MAFLKALVAVEDSISGRPHQALVRVEQGVVNHWFISYDWLVHLCLRVVGCGLNRLLNVLVRRMDLLRWLVWKWTLAGEGSRL